LTGVLPNGLPKEVEEPGLEGFQYSCGGQPWLRMGLKWLYLWPDPSPGFHFVVATGVSGKGDSVSPLHEATEF